MCVMSRDCRSSEEVTSVVTSLTSMTLDRVDVASRRSASSSSSSSFLHGVKKAVILLCPGDDQSTRAVGLGPGPGRAVRVQFASPTSTTTAAADTGLQHRVDTERYDYHIASYYSTHLSFVHSASRQSKLTQNHVGIFLPPPRYVLSGVCLFVSLSVC